jgi:hypothetical protein
MALPIQQQPGQIVNQQVAVPPLPQAPIAGGLANAPTTLQSSIPSIEKGYIVTAVQAIINFVSFLFSKIFFCFSKADSPAPAPIANALQLPPMQPPVELPQPKLAPKLQADIDLMNAFKRLPEDTQKRIYTLVGGENRSIWQLRDWTNRDNQDLGMKKVFENPQILRKYIEI